jgi:hypothetical protein
MIRSGSSRGYHSATSANVACQSLHHTSTSRFDVYRSPTNLSRRSIDSLVNLQSIL